MRHIIPISGKDSLCTAIVQTAKEPDLSYEYIFNDNGSELPETYEWLNRIEEIAGIKISRIQSNLEDIIKSTKVLPSPKMRFCTSKSKIKPMEKFIGKDVFTIYIGLRADEPQRIGYESSKAITRFP